MDCFIPYPHFKVQEMFKIAFSPWWTSGANRHSLQSEDMEPFIVGYSWEGIGRLGFKSWSCKLGDWCHLSLASVSSCLHLKGHEDHSPWSHESFSRCQHGNHRAHILIRRRKHLHFSLCSAPSNSNAWCILFFSPFNSGFFHLFYST